MLTLKIKRATRAQLNTAASSNNLEQGEPYLITDENRMAVGLTSGTYESMAKQSETIIISATEPPNPFLNMLWLDIS
jgi:PHD/YefM family antitoxin component YafN of YafNO toxin-antitoxin module